MGYACPVCGDPQSDDEHLANHLAFTAMLGDADHEDWLDERVPEWGSLGPDELAPQVTDHAEETEFPQVFEDTTGDAEGHDHEHGHQHGQGHGRQHGREGGRGPSGLGGRGMNDPGAYDAEGDPDDVIAEAMELTRRMREGDDESADDGPDADERDDADDE